MSDVRGGMPSMGGRYDWAAEYEGRTYYQRSGVCVTDRYLVAMGRRYDVTDLRALWTTRSPRDPLVVGAAIVAAVAVLAVVLGWPRDDQVSGWITLGAVSAVTVSAAAVINKIRSRHYELWATYRGAEVRLLDLASGEHFWQICRALVRAREARDAADEAQEYAGTTATTRSLGPTNRAPTGGRPAAAAANARMRAVPVGTGGRAAPARAGGRAPAPAADGAAGAARPEPTGAGAGGSGTGLAVRPASRVRAGR